MDDGLDPDRRAGRITAVSMNMSAGYAKSVAKPGHAPTAIICYDPFHVVALTTKALAKVRREVWNDLRPGFNTGSCPPAPSCTTPGAAGTLTLQVSGHGGVPASGVTAVVMNVTARDPSAASFFLTVYPSNATRPTASNLNYVGLQAPVPNLVTVKLGTDGLGPVNIYNNAGTVNVLADVVGWYSDGTS